MKSKRDSLRKHLHDIANALQNAFETIDNVNKHYEVDPHYCKEALRAVSEERTGAFCAIENLRLQLKKMGVYEK